jgi:polyisoprenoid-binding protein YceI/mono/diheme cytochrome c family protein
MLFGKFSHIPLSLCLLWLSACSYSYDKNASSGQDASAGGPVGFEQVRTQVFASACMNCHDKKPPDLTNFVVAHAARDKIKQSVFDEKKMPKNGTLTAKQSALLFNWLSAGAPEFPQAAGSAPTPATPSAPGKKILWKDLRQQVLDVACNSCHSPHNNKGVSDFTDLKNFRSSISTVLYLTLIEKKKQMPPPPDTFTEEQKRMLADWVIQGELDDDGNPPVPEAQPGTNPEKPVDTSITYHLAPRASEEDGIHFDIGYILGSHHGKASSIGAKVVAKNDKDFSLENVQINVPLSGIKTGDDTRDCHVQEALGLNYEKSAYPREHVCDDHNTMRETPEFPSVTLALAKLPLVIPQSETFADIHAGAELAIHGKTQAIEIPLHVEFEEGSKQKLHVTTHFNVKLADFGIEVKPVFLGFSVHDQATVNVDLHLVSDQLQAPGPYEKQDLEFALLPGPGGETGVNFDIGYFAGTHHGSAHALNAQLVMQLGENFSIKAGKFSVPVESMDTDNKTRNCHLREALTLDYTRSRFPNEHVCDSDDQLPASGNDSAAFPQIELEMTDYAVAGGRKALVAGDALDLDLKAKVQMHGVTKENVPIRVRVSYTDGPKGLVRITGNFTLLLSSYGATVKPVVGNFGTVNDEATVNLDLLFAPKPTQGKGPGPAENSP